MPDENAFLTFVIQLLINFRIHTLISNTSKNFQLAYFGLSSMSTFIWRHILNIFCWPSNIEEKNRSWKIFRFEQAHCDLNYHYSKLHICRQILSTQSKYVTTNVFSRRIIALAKWLRGATFCTSKHLVGREDCEISILEGMFSRHEFPFSQCSTTLRNKCLERRRTNDVENYEIPVADVEMRRRRFSTLINDTQDAHRGIYFYLILIVWWLT